MLNGRRQGGIVDHTGSTCTAVPASVKLLENLKTTSGLIPGRALPMHISEKLKILLYSVYKIKICFNSEVGRSFVMNCPCIS